jgi:ribonucleotide reductase, class II
MSNVQIPAEPLRTHHQNGLQDYIAISRYARYSPEKRRRETWSEAVSRVRDMHLNRYGEKSLSEAAEGLIAAGTVSEDVLFKAGLHDSLHAEIFAAFSAVKDKEVLPSMRSLQFGGDAILTKHARIYNCAYTHIDRMDAFREAFYLLLCGCGVGFSVQRQHVAKLPALAPRDESRAVETFVVADTIEGWAEALDALMLGAVEGRRLQFDFSQIRPAGAPLRTSGGKAPGPQPLMHALKHIEGILNSAAGRRLRSIEAYDCLMWGAKAVLSGGIRRSATICLFSADDEEMTSAKTGNWFEKHPQRAASNNSAVIVRQDATREVFNKLFEAQKQYGEPGFYFVEDADYGANPCVPADTWVMTGAGPRQVHELIGQRFEALVNGKKFKTTDSGFFETGVKPLLRLCTKEGHSLRLTANHKVLVERSSSRQRDSENPDGTRIRISNTEWVEAGSLVAGDRVVLHRHDSAVWGGYGGQEEGWLLGSLVGDGNLCASKETAYLDFWGENRLEEMAHAVTAIHQTVGAHGQVKPRGGDQPKYERCRVGSRELYRLADRFGLEPGCKELPDLIEHTSSDFHSGFLRGWFDADGSVQGTSQKGISVRLTSVSKQNLERAQRMLLRLGVVSTLYCNRNRFRSSNWLPNGRGGVSEYAVQALHELVIARSNLKTFALRVGFSSPEKRTRLQSALASYRRNLNAESFTATVVALEPAGEERVYDCTVPGPHAFDAEGFYAHNCVEIGLNPRVIVDEESRTRLRELGYQGELADGQVLSGVQFCNLSTLSAGAAESPERFYRLCAQAALIGTLQAGYTEFSYLSPVSRYVTEREALIGVSICGILDRPNILLDPKVLETGAAVIKAVNRVVARALGIRPAARTTCVKPEGTASLLLGTSSGLHPHHAVRYFRRVQANVYDPVFKHFKRFNPHMVEPSVYDPHGRTEVITFPVEGPAFGIYREELSALQHLDYIRRVQIHWVQAGRADETYSPGLHHNVSCTVSVKDDEWSDVADFIWSNRDSFTGIALLADSGDKAYAQAPREGLANAADHDKWNTLMYSNVPYEELCEDEDITELKQVIACAGGACELV